MLRLDVCNRNLPLCARSYEPMSKATEYDSPLKEAWRIYFHSFMRLCFPKVERAIKWSRPPEFLDKELRKIVREAESGKKFLDLLIKVWLRDDSEEWILLQKFIRFITADVLDAMRRLNG